MGSCVFNGKVRIIDIKGLKEIIDIIFFDFCV